MKSGNDKSSNLKIDGTKNLQVNLEKNLRYGSNMFPCFILVKVVATESGVKMETPKSLKRIPLPFSVDPNPRDSVPGKLCFLGFIELVTY